MTDDRLILVTGATGQQGGAVARELLARGRAVRAMTRSPDGETAESLATRGAEVVRGDLDDADSLRRALDGAWGVLSIQNTWEAGVEREEEQGKRLARVAKETGVRHFVYHSVASADRETGIPHFDNKFRIEQTVRGLGFPSWTIIRPVFFMENLSGPGFKPAIEDGTLALGIEPDTPLQMIAVADIGRYGARAFEHHEEMSGRAIDIAGDEMTATAIAEVLSEATGREITHHRVPIEQVRESSEDLAIMLEWFDAVGYDADIAGNAAEFGIRPTPLREWATGQSWG